MRKRIDEGMLAGSAPLAEVWLDLASAAEIEVTSEDPAHPIEGALLGGAGSGWKASRPGRQIVRVLFDQPQALSLIHLLFTEDAKARTQEFVLRWSGGGHHPFREIVRQQYNFTAGAKELEEYRVELSGVKSVELEIMPSIGGGDFYASLRELRFR